MASAGRSRSRCSGEGGGSFERNVAHSTVPVPTVDHYGAGSLRKQASNSGILPNSPFAMENRQSKAKKSGGVPIKKLIDEEFSKDVNARHISPGAVGRLMGLDSLPSFEAHSQHKYTRSHAHRTSPYSSHDRYAFSEDMLHRRSTDEMPEVKDVFEVMEATRLKAHRSPRSRNGNVTSRLDVSESNDLDYIRQKFVEAKRLSSNESLQMSEELDETLDALVSNRGLLLKFLEKHDPAVRRDLQDHGDPSSTANCITILRPSRRNQFIDTDSNYSQDKGTESYFHHQKEGKHSLRVPHAKLSSQSLKEDSSAFRQKLSRSSNQEISDRRVCPTRIVVLKPSLEKTQDIEGGFALAHEIPHSGYRRHKECQDAGIWSPYNDESMFQAPLGYSETLGHIAKGSKEIAREITKQMRAARGSGGRKQAFKPDTGTSMFDEKAQFLSSLTKLKTSEAVDRSSELCDDWASSSFNSSPAHGTETLVSKEAKKHLSNRWKMTRQYQHQAPGNNGSGMLGDMFALSDQESSKDAIETLPCQKCPKGESQRDKIPGSYSNPRISSTDDWRDVVTSNLTRSKSLPSSFNQGVQKSNNRKRTGRNSQFSMLKDVLKVGSHDSEYACRSRQRKSSVRGSTFHGDEAVILSPDNEESMIVEREIHVSSEEPTNVIGMPDSSEQTLIHTVNAGHQLDAVSHLDNSCAVLEQKIEHRSPVKLNQQMHQQQLAALDCCLPVPSLDNLVTQTEGIEQVLDHDCPAMCNPPTGSVSPVGIDHHQGADNQTPWIPPTRSESPMSSGSDDHPSPVSVLESSLDAEDAYSGDFERISSDLQELRMQLRLLKMETTDNADATNPSIVSEDEIASTSQALPEMEISHAFSDDEIASTSQPLPEMEISHAFRDEEERDFSYVLDMLILLGVDAASQDALLDICYLSECPVGLDLYDILENKYNSLILWSPSDRKLLFDLTNAVIADIITSLAHHVSKGLSQVYSSWWDQEGFIDEVWQRVVQLRHEMEYVQEGISMDLEWFGSEDGVVLIVDDIGRMLHDDLVEETIVELLGVTESINVFG